MPPDAGALPDTLTPPPPPVADRTSLFLDLDGVLAPIAPVPDAVGPDPARTRLLRRLVGALDGRVAVLSGRSIAEVDRICEAAVTAVAGVHGLERRRRDGAVIRGPLHPGLAAADDALEAFAAAHAGVRLERKRGALALHYRQAPQVETAAGDLARAQAERHGLGLQPGKMVFELKSPGADKGVALSQFQAEAPFAGRAPIAVGDDLTDEHAFAAANRCGGYGVLVGPRRTTAARYRLDDVEAVFAWLDQLAGDAA